MHTIKQRIPRTSSGRCLAMGSTRNWLISVGIAVLLSACSGNEQGASLGTVHVGVLPDQSEKVVRERYAPLLGFLSNETGAVVELVVPRNYEELVRLFGEGKIDLAYFGGVTFVKANALHDAVPLVMRDLDTRFTSVLMVAADGARAIEELKGKRFSFGSRLSTSGHLMPRYFLQTEYGINPEDYFDGIQYSGTHDRTAYWVRDGKVDAGIANSDIVRGMFADGRLSPEDVRILWETPPYTDYVWAAHPQVTRANREQLQQAFLKLSVDNAGHKNILSNVGAGSFYPVSIRDFVELKEVMARLGML